MNRDRALDAVRKLTAKARSCAEIGNVVEAEVFEDKAQELMAKYGVRQADIDPPKPQWARAGFGAPQPVYTSGTTNSAFRVWVTQDGPWRIRWTVEQ